MSVGVTCVVAGDAVLLIARDCPLVWVSEIIGSREKDGDDVMSTSARLLI